MDLREYLNQTINEKLATKMLIIDNAVQHQNINYEDIIDLINGNFDESIDIEGAVSVISDGDLENTIGLLIKYFDKINYVYTDKHNLAILIYLVSMINDYLEYNGLENRIILEKDIIDKDLLANQIIITGCNEFVDDFSNRYKDKIISELII